MTTQTGEFLPTHIAFEKDTRGEGEPVMFRSGRAYSEFVWERGYSGNPVEGDADPQSGTVPLAYCDMVAIPMTEPQLLAWRKAREARREIARLEERIQALEVEAERNSELALSVEFALQVA